MTKSRTWNFLNPCLLSCGHTRVRQLKFAGEICLNLSRGAPKNPPMEEAVKPHCFSSPSSLPTSAIIPKLHPSTRTIGNPKHACTSRRHQAIISHADFYGRIFGLLNPRPNCRVQVLSEIDGKSPLSCVIIAIRHVLFSNQHE